MRRRRRRCGGGFDGRHDGERATDVNFILRLDSDPRRGLDFSELEESATPQRAVRKDGLSSKEAKQSKRFRAAQKSVPPRLEAQAADTAIELHEELRDGQV